MSIGLRHGQHGTGQEDLAEELAARHDLEIDVARALLEQARRAAAADPYRRSERDWFDLLLERRERWHASPGRAMRTTALARPRAAVRLREDQRVAEVLVRATAGEPGEVPYRRELERFFGTALPAIDAYTGRRELRELGARGAATERTVVFADDRPSLPQVAHEVTHVLQHERATGRPAARHRIAEAESPAEHEAGAAAAAVRLPWTSPFVVRTQAAVGVHLERDSGAAAPAPGPTGSPAPAAAPPSPPPRATPAPATPPPSVTAGPVAVPAGRPAPAPAASAPRSAAQPQPAGAPMAAAMPAPATTAAPVGPTGASGPAGAASGGFSEQIAAAVAKQRQAITTKAEQVKSALGPAFEAERQRLLTGFDQLLQKMAESRDSALADLTTRSEAAKIRVRTAATTERGKLDAALARQQDAARQAGEGVAQQAIQQAAQQGDRAVQGTQSRAQRARDLGSRWGDQFAAIEGGGDTAGKVRSQCNDLASKIADGADGARTMCTDHGQKVATDLRKDADDVAKGMEDKIKDSRDRIDKDRDDAIKSIDDGVSQARDGLNQSFNQTRDEVQHKRDEATQSFDQLRTAASSQVDTGLTQTNGKLDELATQMQTNIDGLVAASGQIAVSPEVTAEANAGIARQVTEFTTKLDQLGTQASAGFDSVLTESSSALKAQVDGILSQSNGASAGYQSDVKGKVDQCIAKADDSASSAVTDMESVTPTAEAELQKGVTTASGKWNDQLTTKMADLGKRVDDILAKQDAQINDLDGRLADQYQKAKSKAADAHKDKPWYESAWDSITGFFGDLFKGIWGFIVGFFEAALDLITGLWDLLKNPLGWLLLAIALILVAIVVLLFGWEALIIAGIILGIVMAVYYVVLAIATPGLSPYERGKLFGKAAFNLVLGFAGVEWKGGELLQFTKWGGLLPQAVQLVKEVGSLGEAIELVRAVGSVGKALELVKAAGGIGELMEMANAAGGISELIELANDAGGITKLVELANDAGGITKLVKLADDAGDLKTLIKLADDAGGLKALIKLADDAGGLKALIKLADDAGGLKALIKLADDAGGLKTLIKLADDAGGLKELIKLANKVGGMKKLVQLAHDAGGMEKLIELTNAAGGLEKLLELADAAGGLEKLAELASAAGGLDKLLGLGEAPQIGSKLEYFLGRATGSAHNIERSQEMLRQLQRIGLWDTSATRQLLTERLASILRDSSNIARIQANGRVVREALLVGPGGFLKWETIWEGAKLITGNLFGKG